MDSASTLLMVYSFACPARLLWTFSTFLFIFPAQHMQKNLNPLRDLGERLCCKFPFIKYPPIHLTAAVLLIFSLKAPLPDYFICRKCSHGYCNQDSFKSHKCSGSSEYYKSDVQMFGHGTQDVYFAVTPSEPPRVQSVAEVLFQSYVDDMQNQPDYNADVTVPHNYRELSQFLAKE